MSERMTDEELVRIEAMFEECRDYTLLDPHYPPQETTPPEVLDALALVAEVKALRAELAEARASGLTPEQAKRLAFADEFNELAGGAS